MQDMLKQKTKDVDLKMYAIRVMESTNSFEYTRNYLISVQNMALKQISCLGGNKKLEDIVNFLSEAYQQ